MLVQCKWSHNEDIGDFLEQLAAVSHSQAFTLKMNLNHTNICEETTWNWVDGSGGSQVTLVTISLRECFSGQPGVMLSLTHCSQMRTAVVTLVVDNSFKLNWNQERGCRLCSNMRTLAFRRAGFSLCGELLGRMRWENTMSRQGTKLACFLKNKPSCYAERPWILAED